MEKEQPSYNPEEVKEQVSSAVTVEHAVSTVQCPNCGTTYADDGKGVECPKCGLCLTCA